MLDRSLASKVLFRLPEPSAILAKFVETGLIALLSIQVARLVWVAVSPLAPPGLWLSANRSNVPQLPYTSKATPDPFTLNRQVAGIPSLETLGFRLFGIRQSGSPDSGAAIIGGPDGQQQSYLIGEQIAPGVRLKAVAADGVVIAHNGQEQHLYIDDSSALPNTPGSATNVPNRTGPRGTPEASLPPPSVGLADIQYQARLLNGEIAGVIVQPDGRGGALSDIGLAAGDVILAINGRRITTPDDVRSLSDRLRTGPRQLEIERGGRVISLPVGR
jgi:general secretion pathway protein C